MTPREASKLIKVVKLAAGENGWRKKKETDEEESDDKEQENKETDTNKEETNYGKQDIEHTAEAQD